MILLVIALVGVSGYAVAVSYGPKLWSEDAGTVAFAAGSLSLFTALVSDVATPVPQTHTFAVANPCQLTSLCEHLTLQFALCSALCYCGAISPVFLRTPAACHQARS